jgi:hypothetical protein
MKIKVRQVLIHLVGCVLFLAVPFYMGPEGIHQFTDIFHDKNLLREFFAFILLLIFFYLNYLVLTPKFLISKKYFLYIAIFIGIFLLIILIPRFLIPFQEHGPPDILRIPDSFRPSFTPEKRPPIHWTHDFFVFLAVTFFSIVLKMANRLKQTEKEKLSSELSYLKAQINPHFLFNTLNGIYSLAIEKSDYTATAVVKLSAMMRYVINETERDFVPLEKEINYIGDYIELQKIRLDDATEVKYEVRGEIFGKKISPLLLIPFIENAFKFGVNPEMQSIIVIKVEIIENELHLKVKNNKVNIPVNTANSSGVGIENAKTRLQLLYPGKHSLTFGDNGIEFFVDLSLNLK